MATTMKGIIGGGLTFTASPATKNSFTITAGNYQDYNISNPDHELYTYYIGYSTTVNGVKIGSVTPQSIDGFKIINLVDITWINQLYDGTIEDSGDYCNITTNHKCILHINGVDYNVTTDKNSVWELTDISKTIGISDGDKVQVTYKLL
nr:MAG TPA: hypothetical protein [Caudoviricetes sp.]